MFRGNKSESASILPSQQLDSRLSILEGELKESPAYTEHQKLLEINKARTRATELPLIMTFLLTMTETYFTVIIPLVESTANSLIHMKPEIPADLPVRALIALILVSPTLYFGHKWIKHDENESILRKAEELNVNLNH